jgi:phage head maturation protease
MTFLTNNQASPATELTPWRVEGYAALYDVPHVGGYSDGSRWERAAKIAPGAFRDSVHFAEAFCCLHHNQDDVIATAEPGLLPKFGELHLIADRRGLLVRIWPIAGKQSREIQRQVVGRKLFGLSWGGPVLEKSRDGDCDVFEKIHLLEISIVSAPYCPGCEPKIVFPGN